LFADKSCGDGPDRGMMTETVASVCNHRSDPGPVKMEEKP
jgi:hypothetical protein